MADKKEVKKEIKKPVAVVKENPTNKTRL